MSRLACHWDTETYSTADLRKVGMFKYAQHPSTELICCAYAICEEAPITWLPGDELPPFVKEPEKYQLHCHNSMFEYVIWKYVMQKTWGNPPGIKYWTDTAAQAAALALPRALGACGEAIDLSEDQKKAKRGRFLVQRLCKPNRGKRIKDLDLLKEMMFYNKQDVVAERALNKKLHPLNQLERKVWELDQAINLRGVAVDINSVKDALVIVDKVTKKLNQEVSNLTKGALINTSQRQKAIDYISDLGYQLDRFDKAYLSEVLKDKELPGIARRIIEIRQQLGKTSTAKYKALKMLVTKDDRAHGLLMYHGASTGRWSGRHFQPQNLPKPSFQDTDTCIELFKHQDPEILEALYNDPMDALSSCVRGMIKASKDKRLIVSDYSAIEARVLAWLAGQEDVLDVFRDHGKIYEHAASQIFKVNIDKVTKNQRLVGKTAVLALGYQGGQNAFRKIADAYGVDIDETRAESIKTDWRKANLKIVQFWWSIEKAAINAVKNKGTSYSYRLIKFRVVGDFLFCKLPSNRLLAYYKPQLVEGLYKSEQISFMGTNSATRKWDRQKTYGGKLAENITQAVARDLLAEAMLRIEKVGYEVVLSVHDEILAEAKKGFGSVKEFDSLMCELPAWAEGLPVEAEGFECIRYRK